MREGLADMHSHQSLFASSRPNSILQRVSLQASSRASIFVAAMMLVAAARAQDPPRPPSLKTVPVPGPTNLGDFVKDQTAAIALGKALFWEMQVGSDGVTACASCHFNAGADSRSKNQQSPGLNRVHADGSAFPDTFFGAGHGPNSTITAADFPLFPSNDVISSQGVFNTLFLGISALPIEFQLVAPDAQGFRLSNANTRRVEPRNTPTVINAVYNFRNFWDGRAQNQFNGVNNWGDRDPSARVFRADNPLMPIAVQVRLEDSSLASQAVTPVLSNTEISAAGRHFPDLGLKLIGGPREFLSTLPGLRPLALQRVHVQDSVLGPQSRYPLPGLSTTYDALVRAAFYSQWWDSPRKIRVASDGTATVVTGFDMNPATKEYTLMQYNFALFFGLAIQAYETTLVANDSPYDRFMDGDPNAISAQAIQGVDLFRSQARGRCINCHEQAELTGASVRRVKEAPTRIREGQILDRGFNNIGVNWTLEDLGVGGKDAFGVPLSMVRLLNPPPPEPIAVDGSTKVPGLRNVELTAPYFHNGGFRTLHQVLEFYSRGGDALPIHSTDGSIVIAPLNVLNNTADELSAFEAFLVSLTDERVRLQRAPFDHPQIFVPNGHVGDNHSIPSIFGIAIDTFLEIPPVGQNGGAPLQKFLGG
jgi:cytochrome c peroxidase